MSRLESPDIAGALYYLQLQSNEQCNLLPSRQAFDALHGLFGPLCQQLGGKVLAYCAFTDSIHLIIRAGDSGIAPMSQWLVDTYTQQYNQTHQRHGSVFYQPLLTVLIEPQLYLLPTIHKLHRLPVSSGLVASPSAYPWCSHREYLAPECPDWLDRQEVLVKVANHRASQLRRYEYFIEVSRQQAVNWLEGENSQYRALASDQYLQKLISTSTQHYNLPDLELSTLTEWICNDYKLEEKDLALWRHHRLSGEVQAVVGSLALSFKIANVKQIAEHFACDVEILVNSIRSLRSRRSMYLFKLQLRLDQWLNKNVQELTPEESNPEGPQLNDSDFNQVEASNPVNGPEHHYDSDGFTEEHELSDNQEPGQENLVDADVGEQEVPILKDFSSGFAEPQQEYSELSSGQ